MGTSMRDSFCKYFAMLILCCFKCHFSVVNYFPSSLPHNPFEAPDLLLDAVQTEAPNGKNKGNKKKTLYIRVNFSFAFFVLYTVVVDYYQYSGQFEMHLIILVD